jgi:hypothetical protein
MLPADSLDLLLPDANAHRLQTARSLVTCLRLVVDAGRRSPAGVVHVSLDRAREEFEAHSRRRVLAAVLDLCRHCLYADVGTDTFAWWDEPELGLQAAWSVLEEHREELDWLPAVPSPNEPALETTVRLLDAARRLGLTEAEAQVWAVRVERARGGVERGESAARELFEQRGEKLGDLAPDALAAWVECLLDRGALRSVRNALADRGELVQRHERLARLAAWTALLSGDPAGARAAIRNEPWLGRLPDALAELRETEPEFLPRLSGRSPVAAPFARAPLSVAPSAVAQRKSVGALAFAAFELRELGQEHLIEFDVAPALQPRAQDWLRRIAGACSESGSAEHELVVGARVAARHRRAPSVWTDCVSPQQVRSIALAPILDERGEVAGWLRWEFEHHLVPSRQRLLALAKAWRARSPFSRVETPPAAKPERRAIHSVSAADGPCAEVFRMLVDELAMKTAQRHWWGFEVVNGELRESVEGGAAVHEPVGTRGGRRGLERALRSAGTVHFGDPAPALALWSGAASGVVLPVTSRGELCGLLAVESARRGDFPAALVERWLERIRALGTELRIARFREWHRRRAGHDVSLSAQGAAASAWTAELFAIARSNAPCAVVGPAGSGKQVVARWLHFESVRRDAPLVFLPAAGDEREFWTAFEAHLRHAPEGTLVCEDLERIARPAQARLAAWLDRSGQEAPRWRWIGTASRPLATLGAAGELDAGLARRLARLELRVPSLAERRAEIPRIANALLKRFADQEQLPAPALDDEALALLWRQPWPGNLRELENLVHKLVLLHPGVQVGFEALNRTARRFHVELVRRVSSRAPDPETLRAALATTANLRGSINKTRAAMYLGWDPDTLVLRMNELEASERSLDSAKATSDAEPGDAGAVGGSGAS